MGVDVNVYLLVGVDYTDVVEEDEIFYKVTKYDPDEGFPYDVTQKKTIWKIGEKTFNHHWEAQEAIENAGLFVYDDGDESVLIGESADELRSDEIASGLGGYVSISDIEKLTCSVADRLSTLGIKNVTISVRIFSQVSC